MKTFFFSNDLVSNVLAMVMAFLIAGLVIYIFIVATAAIPSDFDRLQAFMTECQEATNHSYEQCLELWKAS